MSKWTRGTWTVACDSYGKVQHSRKACVYTVVDDGQGERIVTIAARIPNWSDANVISASKQMLNVLAGLNHVERGYCICPLNDGLGQSDKHSTSCKDARYAVAKALNLTYATGELLPDAFEQYHDAVLKAQGHTRHCAAGQTPHAAEYVAGRP
jgi:hypothetical protein